MKKKFSLLMLALLSIVGFATAAFRADAAEQEPVAQDTWTVAGSNTDLFGTAWDPANTANDMTLTNGVYVWSKSDVTLPAGQVLFKICKDNAWNEAYPAQNYEVSLEKSGKYDVTITFNAESKDITTAFTLTEETAVTVDYFLVGSFNNWTQKDENYKLAKNEAAQVEEYSITLDMEAGTEFKVISSTSTWYPGGDNLSVQAAGNYTIYFRPVANDEWGGNIYVQPNSTEQLNTYTAKFENNGNWAEVYAYTYSMDEESNVTAQELGAWPGKKIEATDEGYIVTIEAAAAPQFIIFNNGVEGEGAVQTEDLVFEDGKTYTYEAPAAPATDISLNLEEGCDIAAALAAETEGKNVGNISIMLKPGEEYTVSAPLVAHKNFEILANGATIDASELSGNLIEMAATADPTVVVPVEFVSIHFATIKGLKKPLFYSTQKGYLIDWLTIDNSIIEVAADATSIDFTKGSAARNVNIENSTIYAPTATTKSFYSSQAGQKLTELDEEGVQTFIVKNSTMYNLATGKNFFTHRQANQKWLAYTVENSLFVNCGKSGQVITGMNGGQSGSNPTWTITGNAFNFEADGEMTDTSAAEGTNDTTEGEGVQNSVAGVVTFTDAEAGDFNGEFDLAEGAAKPESLGDRRWNIKFNSILVSNGTYYVMNASAGAVVNDDDAIDAKGAPMTFTYDADTKSYNIEGTDIFDDNQWTITNQYEDMPGYYYFTTVVDEATKYLTVDAEGKLTLADAADDNAVWIVLEKAYWEDIANSTYTVAGTKNLTGTDEDWQIAEANQMKYNEETKLFEITFSNITVSNDVKPEFKVLKVNMDEEESWFPENNWVITPEVLAGEGEYDITITFDPSDSKEITVSGLKIEDINITPENGADIFEALIAAEMGKKPRNITINLIDKGSYTVTGPLTAYANFEIQGNNAFIDASGLNYNLIQMAATANPAIEFVSIHNATVKGLKKPLFYSTQKGYLINWLTIDNSIIEVAADATTIDFTKGSAARNVNIENSTIYAPTATTKSFYSSQAGQKLTELDEEGIQTFIVKNSTMYNLAKGKNFFTHRQSNQKWLAYDVENSIFVNCGKSGQVIKGMNGGQGGSNPTWTITGNAFNFEADGVMTDTSAAEDTGDTTEGEGVQNSVAGVVTFTDAAAGEFNGEFQLAEGAAKPESLGDGRWAIIFKGGAEVETTYYLVGTFNNWTASDTYKLTLNENASEGVVEYTITTDIPANSSMKVLDNIGNWYPATGPDFVVNDEGNYTVYFRPNADGDEFWFDGYIYCQYNGVPTGISTVKADNLKDAQIFNLAGQRMQSVQKGLYIVNGKKVVMK